MKEKKEREEMEEFGGEEDGLSRAGGLGWLGGWRVLFTKQCKMYIVIK